MSDMRFKRQNFKKEVMYFEGDVLGDPWNWKIYNQEGSSLGLEMAGGEGGEPRCTGHISRGQHLPLPICGSLARSASSIRRLTSKL